MILGYCATKNSSTSCCLLVVFNRPEVHFPSTKPPAARGATTFKMMFPTRLRTKLIVINKAENKPMTGILALYMTYL